MTSPPQEPTATSRDNPPGPIVPRIRTIVGLQDAPRQDDRQRQEKVPDLQRLNEHVAPVARRVLRVDPGPRLRQKVESIRAMLRNDDCYLIYVTAGGKGVRWGKSGVSAYLANLIEPGFQPTQVVFTPFGWNAKQEELSPGQMVVKDEPRGSQKRRSMSTENFQQQEDLTEWGFRNLGGIIIHPKAGQMDRAQLGLADAWVHIHKKREAATWRDIIHQTALGENGPEDHIRMSRGFTFPFPDPAEAFPVYWSAYQDRSRYYKRTGLEPDYDVQVDEEEYQAKRKKYLRIRRMQRMERTVGKA
jgi:hypothetical protein